MRLTWEVSGGDRHLKFYEVRDDLSGNVVEAPLGSADVDTEPTALRTCHTRLPPDGLSDASSRWRSLRVRSGGDHWGDGGHSRDHRDD
jgi:hypothetical protein